MELDSLADYKSPQNEVSSRGQASFESFILSDYESGQVGFPVIPPPDEDSPIVTHTPSHRKLTVIFQMVNALLGAGVLGVPDAFKPLGTVLSVALLAFMVSLSYIATVMIIYLRDDTQASGLDELTTMILGRVGSIFNSVCSIIFCLTAMMAYLISNTDTIQTFYGLMFRKENTPPFKFDGTTRLIVVLLYSLLIPIPTTIPKSVKVLQILSYFKMIPILLFVCSMVYVGIGAENKIFKDTIPRINFFKSLGLFMLSFTLPVFVLPPLAHYDGKMKKRTSAAAWTLFLCFIIVAIAGIFGYMKFGPGAKDNVLNSLISDSPILGAINQIAYFLILNFTYPSVAEAAQCALSQIFFQINTPKTLEGKKRALVLIVTNIIPLAGALKLPEMGPALNIGGSVGGIMGAFFFPALMWIVHSDKRFYSWKNLLCIILCIFSVGATLIAVGLQLNIIKTKS